MQTTVGTASEEIRNKGKTLENHVLRPDADSAACVLYDYYGGRERFPDISGRLCFSMTPGCEARNAALP